MVFDRVEIAAQLRDDITSGKYRTGDKLPSYRQLGKSLGAAPNTVGEAVRLLAAEGLVTTRPGAPAVIRCPDDVPAAPEDKLGHAHATLSDLRVELRDVRSRLDAAENEVSRLIADLEA